MTIAISKCTNSVRSFIRVIGNIYMNLDFPLRTRTYEKRLTGKQP